MCTVAQYKAYVTNAYRCSKEWLQGPWWFQQSDPLTKFTGWVAAYTFTLTLVSALQFCTLQQTDKTTREALTAVQRAFVFAGPLKGRAIPTRDHKIEWHFSVAWENSGSTPTQNLRLNLNCWVEPESIIDHPEKFNHFLAIGNYSNVIGPHAPIDMGECLLSADEIATIQNTNQAYYLAARADYQDVFQSEYHRTEKCIEITPFIGDFSKIGADQSLQSRSCPFMNCSDKECERQDQKKK